MSKFFVFLLVAQVAAPNIFAQGRIEPSSDESVVSQESKDEKDLDKIRDEANKEIEATRANTPVIAEQPVQPQPAAAEVVSASAVAQPQPASAKTAVQASASASVDPDKINLKEEFSKIRVKQARLGGAYDLKTGLGVTAGAGIASKSLELRGDIRAGASETGTILPYSNLELSGKKILPIGVKPLRFEDKIPGGKTIYGENRDSVSFTTDRGLGVLWQVKATREQMLPISESVKVGVFGEAGVRHSDNWFLIPFAQAGVKTAVAECQAHSEDGKTYTCFILNLQAAAGFPQLQASLEMGGIVGRKLSSKEEEQKGNKREIRGGLLSNTQILLDGVDQSKVDAQVKLGAEVLF